MIKITEKIDNIFRALYESEAISVYQNYSYDDIIDSNESRLNYIIHLFDKIENNELSEECNDIFKQNIDYLYAFINGELETELTVPKKYYADTENCLIVPQPEDLEYVFRLFEANKEIFDMLYKNKKFMIELPKNSFNQNMKRILEVEEYNLAHLLGITDSEPNPDPNKNLLKKYFMNNVKNNEQYGNKISERLLNWILSDEGKNELRRINKITIEFINEDKKINPNKYNENGVLKPKSLDDFKERFKNATGLEFPLIKFSKYIVKSINSLNFLNMTNIFQIILDYNAPKGKNNEKDIFIVNSSTKLISKEISDYVKLNEKIMEVIVRYANDKEGIKDQLQELLKDIGINIKDEDISSFINIIQSYDFVGKHDINPNQEIAFEKIRNIINKYFKRNIHLIGFDTYFDDRQIEIDEATTNYTHCDTSISLTAAELVGEYYEKGRPFFLDKISDESGKKLIRLSNPKEEILYLDQMKLIDSIDLNYSEILQSKLSIFNEKYLVYKNSLNNGKKK